MADPKQIKPFVVAVLEKAQTWTNHEPLRTTTLYDRTRDQIVLDEIERIAI